MHSIELRDVLTQLEKLAAIETSPRARFTYVPLPADIVARLTTVQAQVAPSDGLKQDLDHITLVYVKKTDEDVPPADIDKAVRAIRDIVAHTPPIAAKVQGWGYFDGAKKDGVDKTALVGLIDAPGLEDLHVELKGALRSIGITPSADHIFTPHVTFCYLEKGKRVENLPTIGGEFTIDKVCFVNADIHEMMLGGAVSLGIKAAASSLRSRVKVVPNGNYQELHLGGKRIGQMLVNHGAPTPAVDAVGIENRFQGMGLGKKLYGDTMKQLGGRLDSGSMVSDEAARVWDSMAHNPGYAVKKNPTFPHPSGKQVSFDHTQPNTPAQEDAPVYQGALRHLVKGAALRHDILPGGKGDHLQPSDVSPRELLRGKATESEHTSNKALAQEIALDHLSEDRHYYSKLEKAMPGEAPDGTKAALARFGLHGVPSSTRRP